MVQSRMSMLTIQRRKASPLGDWQILLSRWTVLETRPTSSGGSIIFLPIALQEVKLFVFSAIQPDASVSQQLIKMWPVFILCLSKLSF